MILTLNKNKWLWIGLFAIILLLMTDSAMAAGNNMPWDAPLTKIKNSMTGPVALAISMIGIVVAGGMLIFGGELGEFARRAVMLALVLALLVAANNVLTKLYGSSSASITQPVVVTQPLPTSLELNVR